jgi:methyl-accepting chemotaxis protein
MKLANLPLLGPILRPLDERIGVRLGSSFGAVCVVMISTVAIAVWQMNVLLAEFATTVDDRVPVLAKLQSLVRAVSAVNLAARDSLLTNDEAASAAALDRIEAGRARIGEEIAQIQALMRDAGDEGRTNAEELGNQSSAVLVTLLKFSRLKKAGQPGPAKELLSAALLPKMESFSAAIDKTQALYMQRLQDGRRGAERAVAMALGITGTMLLAGLVVAGVLAWRISRGVTRPVIETVRLAESIASGNLCNELPTVRSDELGRLQQAVLDMQRQLSELVGVIKRSAGNIAVASDEIAEGSHHLSRRTEQASSSLQKTAGAMDHLVGTVRQSADAAREANTMAATAAHAAQRGGNVVSQVVDRMAEISLASGKIADITGVIDSIAFQTNILALNAAVEAARAGEHGKGFAVVAAEVRTLAHRAAKAAQEIKGLIGESVSKVEAGSGLVRDAGTTMREIMTGVERVTKIVNEICASASEQSAGLGEVNAAVGDLDSMTQQNAALVEESTAAAEGLRDQAQALQTLVNRFRLDAHA